MNWKQYISGFTISETGFTFNPPASQQVLQDLKLQFGITEIPSELNGLFEETNGVNEMLNGVVIGELIWPVERVIRTNKEYRSDKKGKKNYMPFDQLFFVSDAGNGDLFGYTMVNGRFVCNDIFAWDHEDDSRTWVAPNLERFIKGWLDGTITV